VIGGGPAGLMAAEVLSSAGVAVTVFDQMPSVGRKLLMAGRGGLNLTHSEPLGALLARYGDRGAPVRQAVEAFPPQALIDWAEGLQQQTFVGSSGRIFPVAMKASPLLRAWLARLAARGVAFRTRCAWRGWDEFGALRLSTEGHDSSLRPDAAVLALGGASWPRLGSDGHWRTTLEQASVRVAPFRPANCGFVVPWSTVFRDRFAGTPLKGLAASFNGRTVQGEAVVTRDGIEGGLVYALSADLRDAIAVGGFASLILDLRPDLPQSRLATRLDAAARGASAATRLRKAGLTPVEISLLRETHGVRLPIEPEALASVVKASMLTLTAPQGLERAISTAGGVAWSEVDEDFQLKARPGVFVAGEMLDWEAPTGGYLLQAAFATGVAAARGVLKHLSTACDR